MNPKAITAIKKKIKGTLLNAEIEDGNVQYELLENHLASMAAEVLKANCRAVGPGIDKLITPVFS